MVIARIKLVFLVQIAKTLYLGTSNSNSVLLLAHGGNFELVVSVVVFNSVSPKNMNV